MNQYSWETLKPISGFNGFYLASSKGYIKTVDHYKKGKGNSMRFYKSKIKYPVIDKNGYLRVKLYHNGKYKWLFVHRLIAETLIPNPKKMRIVKHKDNNNRNNNISNLEWGEIFVENLQAGHFHARAS